MIELYNEDFTETLKRIKDKSIDLIVTDPPYEIANTKGCGSISRITKINESQKDLLGEIKQAGLNTGGTLNDKKHFVDSLVKITRGQDITKGYDIEQFADLIVPKMKNINIYFFCNKKQIPDYFRVWVDKYKCKFEIIVWNKLNCVPAYHGHYLVDSEYCLCFHKGRGVYPANYEDAKTIYQSNLNVSDKKKYGHPTIKPLPLIEKLIRNSSEEGDLVFDPFSGSATTGVACKNLNRNFIGSEIYKPYFEIGQRRLAE